MENATGHDREFQKSVGRLVETLRLDVEQHRQLLKIMEVKKKAMVSMKREELEKVLDLEREAVSAIGVVEEERIHLTAQISDLMGSPRGSAIKLSEILMYVDGDYQEELLDLRDELRDIADEMERLNRINQSLVVHSLDHIHLYIAMLAGTDPDSMTYTKKGAQGEEPASLLMDRRI